MKAQISGSKQRGRHILRVPFSSAAFHTRACLLKRQYWSLLAPLPLTREYNLFPGVAHLQQDFRRAFPT